MIRMIKSCDRCGDLLTECRCNPSLLRLGASLQRMFDELYARKEDRDIPINDNEYNRGYIYALEQTIELYSEIFGSILEYKR